MKTLSVCPWRGLGGYIHFGWCAALGTGLFARRILRDGECRGYEPMVYI